MYYILVPQQLIKSRGVFTDYQTLPGGDGRTILPVGDLRFTQFSYGQVELINQEDLDSLVSSLKAKSSSSSSSSSSK